MSLITDDVVSEQPYGNRCGRMICIFTMMATVVLFLGLTAGVCLPQSVFWGTDSWGPENSVHFLSQSSGKSDDIALKPENSDSNLETQAKKQHPSPRIELTTGLNARRDSLDWNIAGQKDGTNPNVLSELTWDNLDIWELTLGIQIKFKNNFYFQGDMSFGAIVAGENQDSDYGADDRQDEFSRSNNNADDGFTFDTSAGLGYMFSLASKRLALIPMAGLSLHRQYLTMTDGYQTIYADDPSLEGPFDGLDSSYDARWLGPWIGFSLRYCFDMGTGFLRRISPRGDLEYHWARYHAEADWNLRSDFEHPKSFEHDAWGDGFLIRAGLGFEFQGNWSLVFAYVQQDWQAEDGVDRVFLSGGGTMETRLNEVNWESRAIRLAFNYKF